MSIGLSGLEDAPVDAATTTIRVRAGIVALRLAMVAVALVCLNLAAHAAVHVFGVRSRWPLELFSLNSEASLPTWFASALLLQCAVLLAAIGFARRAQSGDYARHWQLLALAFLGLSADEAASMHEKAIVPLRTLLGTDGLFYFAWIIPAGLLVMGLGLAFRGFIGHLPAPLRRHAVIAALLFLGGAIGMESVGGSYVAVHGEDPAIFDGDDHLAYALLTTIEEALEMAGTILFILVLLRYMEVYRTYFGIRFGACRLAEAHDLATQRPSGPEPAYVTALSNGVPTARAGAINDGTAHASVEGPRA